MFENFSYVDSFCACVLVCRGGGEENGDGGIQRRGSFHERAVSPEEEGSRVKAVASPPADSRSQSTARKHESGTMDPCSSDDSVGTEDDDDDVPAVFSKAMKSPRLPTKRSFVRDGVPLQNGGGDRVEFGEQGRRESQHEDGGEDSIMRRVSSRRMRTLTSLRRRISRSTSSSRPSLGNVNVLPKEVKHGNVFAPWSGSRCQGVL